MVVKLLPCLSGKIEHLFIAIELKTLGKLRQKVHTVYWRLPNCLCGQAGIGCKCVTLSPVFRQSDVNMLCLRLSLNFSPQHLLKCFSVFSCFFQSLCFYLSHPGDAEDESC